MNWSESSPTPIGIRSRRRGQYLPGLQRFEAERAAVGFLGAWRLTWRSREMVLRLRSKFRFPWPDPLMVVNGPESTIGAHRRSRAAQRRVVRFGWVLKTSYGLGFNEESSQVNLRRGPISG